MSNPGFVFALVVGVAIGVAAYFFSYQTERPFENRNDNYGSNHDYYSSSTNINSNPNSRNRRKKKPSECIICFDSLETKAEKILKCGHVFHNDCIETWFNEKRSCPVCRSI